MIIVRLQGGLGNQMFQYAMGKALSIKHKTSLCLDDSLMRMKLIQEGHIHRDFELDIFALKYVFASNDEVAKLQKKPFSLLAKFFNVVFKNQNSVIELRHIYEKNLFVYDAQMNNISKDCYVDGYWQNEKYFKGIESILRDEFRFKSSLSEINAMYLNQIRSKNSVSIHVRRGDYVSNKHAATYHGGITTLDYYHTAVAEIAKKVKNPFFYVFSDDPIWSQENIKIKEFEVTYISHNVGPSNYEDMRLMSACKHNIIANSSFSWWGAWLNNNSEKIVIAPSKWMNGEGIDDSDICPKEWIRI